MDKIYKRKILTEKYNKEFDVLRQINYTYTYTNAYVIEFDYIQYCFYYFNKKMHKQYWDKHINYDVKKCDEEEKEYMLKYFFSLYITDEYIEDMHIKNRKEYKK